MFRLLAAVLLLIATGLSPRLVAAADGVDPPVARDARVAGDELRTRFVLDVSREVKVGTFTMGDPTRVILDLPQVRFDLPADAGLTGRGLVKGWRYGLFAKGRSRIVIDTTGPVAIDKSFMLPSVEGQPARLVVDLVKVDEAAFRAELQKTVLTREAANDVPVTKGDRLDERPVEGKPIVMLDPGHGGVDAGTIAPSGNREKDVVLAFAYELKTRLEATGKVEVRMTRSDDTFVPLDERVKIAQEANADLLVSIHADSVRQDFVRGATVYTLSERASDQDAAALAAKENASDAIAGMDLQRETDEVNDILVDLTRRETKNFSLAFANGLVAELSSATRMIRNPHRAAGFRVLRAPDVPSVLLEIGYLSNSQDEKLLTSEDWRDRATDAIANAIMRFFGPKIAAVSD